jgi:hypothetical protein
MEIFGKERDKIKADIRFNLFSIKLNIFTILIAITLLPCQSSAWQSYNFSKRSQTKYVGKFLV